MVMLDSILITAAIDVLEEHEVAVMDSPCAFLHVEIEREIIMKMEGKLSELMVRIEPCIC